MLSKPCKKGLFKLWKKRKATNQTPLDLAQEIVHKAKEVGEPATMNWWDTGDFMFVEAPYLTVAANYAPAVSAALILLSEAVHEYVKDPSEENLNRLKELL
jgi:hypothetical protein